MERRTKLASLGLVFVLACRSGGGAPAAGAAAVGTSGGHGAGSGSGAGASSAAPQGSAGPVSLPPAPMLTASYASSRRFVTKAGGAPKAAGSPLRGAVTGAGPAFETSTDLEGGRCYRFEASGAGTAKFLSLTVRDADGAVAVSASGREATVAAPAAGLVCPKGRESVRVAVAAGAGDGAVTVQVLVE